MSPARRRPSNTCKRVHPPHLVPSEKAFTPPSTDSLAPTHHGPHLCCPGRRQHDLHTSASRLATCDCFWGPQTVSPAQERTLKTKEHPRAEQEVGQLGAKATDRSAGGDAGTPGCAKGPVPKAGILDQPSAD